MIKKTGRNSEGGMCVGRETGWVEYGGIGNKSIEGIRRLKWRLELLTV